MVEVICEECHTVQTTNIFEEPVCEECGAASLSGGASDDPVLRLGV